MYKLRFYYDGKLKHSATKTDVARVIRNLDAIQADWSRNIMPQVAPGQFDPNNASEVIRESPTELFVITTGSHKLRWILVNIERSN